MLIVPLLLGTSLNIKLQLQNLILNHQLQQEIIVTSKMQISYKTCYCGLESIKRIQKYTLITPLLVYISVETNIRRKGRGQCTFVTESQYPGQMRNSPFSNVIDCKAINVPSTTRTTTLLTDILLKSSGVKPHLIVMIYTIFINCLTVLSITANSQSLIFQSSPQSNVF